LQLGDSRLLKIDARTLRHSLDRVEAVLSEAPKHRR
jgi:hypothetical protein